MPPAPFRPVKIGFGGVRAGSNMAVQVSQLIESFKSWTYHMSNQSGVVLYEALKPTFDLSQKYVPVETGDLKASGYLEVSRRGALRAYEAEIGYARGGFPDYAVYVHETPVFHQAPTRWKFLQAAIEEDSDGIRQRIINGVKVASGT